MKRIDWHAGFVSAMKLELLANEDSLEYDDEHYVSEESQSDSFMRNFQENSARPVYDGNRRNRAQRIDLLIIKKTRTTKIVNEIGAIFDKFNIIEYKGPGSGLTYGDFYKILGYTSIYLEELHRYDEYGRDAFTMTFVRRSKPKRLMQLLVNRDKYEIEAAAKGIYEIRGALPFRTQIIVTSEWDQEDSEVHTWLRSLTNEGTQEELQGILKATQSLDDRNRKYADNVVDVFAGANRDLVRKSKEEKRMSAVINELFAEETAAANRRADEAEAKLVYTMSELNYTKGKLNDTESRLKEALAEIGRLKESVN